MIKTLAVMTSGGDSPGMNAAVRAVVRRALDRGIVVYGVFYGYEGLVKGGDQMRLMNWEDVGGIIQQGGTFLGTARSEHFRTKEGRQEVVRHLIERGIEALIVIGGDGSLMGAHTLSTEWAEHVDEIARKHPEMDLPFPIPPLQVIGLPGSIDNDLHGTDMSIGADTALNHIVDAIDNLASTAASHQRTFILETMGRHCGYLALKGALAGSASWVLIPEEELELRWHQQMTSAIEKARAQGHHHQMIVIAEGARHPDGLLINSNDIKKILTDKLGIDVRITVLGHVQRGGSPSAFDRILSTRLGVAAVDVLLDNPDTLHRHMVGLVQNKVAVTPLVEVVEKSRAVQAEIENGNYPAAQALRGANFTNTLDLVRKLTQVTPARECTGEGPVVILTSGSDAPGMNTAVSVSARCLLDEGIPVLGSRDGFCGLVRGEFAELDWHQMVGWMSRPGSEIGTARFDLSEEDYPQIADCIVRHKIRGIVAIGGWKMYLNVLRLVERQSAHTALKVPVFLVPASIDNNLPCSEHCIGSDTALNNIVQAVDKIGNTAGSTRRTFIVEVMGQQCGFLALMGALASGAQKAYLPEIGISLADLNADVEMLRRSFEYGRRMVILLRNESASSHYTTEFVRHLMEAESNGEYEVRTAVLGHVQRGGAPSAFDRLIASRLGAAAAAAMVEALKRRSAEVSVLGLSGMGVVVVPLTDALEQMSLEEARPTHQSFMQLLETVYGLAKYAPAGVSSGPCDATGCKS